MKDRGSSAMSDTHEEDKIFAAVPILGLTSQEVAERVASGDVNADVGAKTRSVPRSFAITFARCSIWST